MSSAVRPDLSIIVVNWNSIQFLQVCLRSIYKHVKGITFEVIVVDNASYDGSAEILHDDFPDVRFIQSIHNLGFSKANNVAYRYSFGNTLLFLNPDTELLDNGIEKMYFHLHSQVSIGAVGCRLLNSDLSVQDKYVQRFPTIWNQILTADMLVRAFPKCKLWCIRPLEFRGTPVEVDVLAGSCIMVKKRVFEHVGCFNENFFMYTEDVDLCYMIRRAGFAIQYTGFGKIIHHCGKSSRSAQRNHFSSVMQRESIALFFKQRRGALYSRTYKGASAFAAFVRVAALSCAIPVASVFSKEATLSLARSKWIKLLRWSLGLEEWAGRLGAVPETGSSQLRY